MPARPSVHTPPSQHHVHTRSMLYPMLRSNITRRTRRSALGQLFPVKGPTVNVLGLDAHFKTTQPLQCRAEAATVVTYMDECGRVPIKLHMAPGMSISWNFMCF